MKHTVFLLAAAMALTSTNALADEHDSRVRAYIVDPVGQVDGLLLADRSSVRFTPQTGESVTRHVHVGDRVQISRDGMTLAGPRGYTVDIGLGTLAARGGGPTFAPPTSTADRASDGMTISSGPVRGTQQFTIEGEVEGLTYTRGHLVDGFVIQGGITVRVRPGLTSELEGLRRGDHVRVEGPGVRGAHGIGLRAERVANARGSVIYPAAG
jgi:hypothetical protein